MYCFSGPGMPADAEGDVPLDEEAEQLLTNSRDRNGVCVCVWKHAVGGRRPGEGRGGVDYKGHV